MTRNYISQTQAEILMAFIILSRSTSYAMTKVGLQELGVFTLLGFRFLLAFFLLAPIFYRFLLKISADELFKGMILGGISALVIAVQVTGLKTADASAAAFLENTAVVFVPVIEAVIHRRFPQMSIISSVIITMIGIALLTIRAGSFNPSEGEILCLIGAVLYAFAIILTGTMSRTGKPIVIGILQVGFMGLFCMIMAAINESVIIPRQPSTWYTLLALSVICTCFGFAFQPLAQSQLTAERAGLFCAVGPVGGALTGWIFLGENINLFGVIGMILILISVILPYIKKRE